VRQGVDPDSEALDPAYEYEFTTDGGAVANFVQEMEMVSTPPGTPLYDTIIKAMRYTVQVSEEPVGRRGIIVITDGGDRESRNNSDVVVDAARNLRVPIYTIGYTGGSREYDQFLNELANRTGGDYRNTPDSEQFDEFLGELREEMTKRYTLTLSVGDFESSRQILDVRVDHNDMVGSDSLKFDVDIDPTPTPEAIDVTATPAEGANGGNSGTGGNGEKTLLEKVRAWVEDNVLYVAIGGGALLLLLIVAIVLLQRRKSAAPGGEQVPYEPPEPGAWDSQSADWGAAPSGGGATVPGTSGPTEMGTAGATEVDEGGEWGGAPTPYYQDKTEAAAPGAPGAYKDFDPPQPSAPQPPQASGGGPQDGGTVMLDRGPKMEHEALLIDRRANRTHELSRPEMRLGRSSDNDIKLDSEKVSRRHALIMLEGDTFYIQDLGSANGTFVNGKQVRDRVALYNGDEVRLGDQTFLFNQLS
ncbi:MAG: FHA domain-containing protein, partial [Chloroflexi bacterium]|nr:FHA domain-containing protein [Chloroflexota bacterium]